MALFTPKNYYFVGRRIGNGSHLLREQNTTTETLVSCYSICFLLINNFIVISNACVYIHQEQRRLHLQSVIQSITSTQRTSK